MNQTLNITDLCEINLEDTIDPSNFSVRGFFPTILKDSFTLCIVVQFIRTRLFFAYDLFLEDSEDSLFYVLDWFCFIHGLNCSLYQSSSSLCTIFDSISFNRKEVLLINLVHSVQVFGLR